MCRRFQTSLASMQISFFFFFCFPQNSCKTCYTEKHSLAVELYTVLISIFSLGKKRCDLDFYKEFNREY